MAHVQVGQVFIGSATNHSQFFRPPPDPRPAVQDYMWVVVKIMGLYRDNGKENGNYYLGFRV